MEYENEVDKRILGVTLADLEPVDLELTAFDLEFLSLCRISAN